MNKDLDMEASENLIANFKSINSGPNADLAAALRALSKIDEVDSASKPDFYPSDAEYVEVIKFRSRRAARRTITTSIFVTGFAISATLGAAALTGVGPKPVINFAKKTISIVKEAATNVANVLINSDQAPIQDSPTSEVVPEKPAISNPDPAQTTPGGIKKPAPEMDDNKPGNDDFNVTEKPDGEGSGEDENPIKSGPSMKPSESASTEKTEGSDKSKTSDSGKPAERDED